MPYIRTYIVPILNIPFTGSMKNAQIYHIGEVRLVIYNLYRIPPLLHNCGSVMNLLTHHGSIVEYVIPFDLVVYLKTFGDYSSLILKYFDTNGDSFSYSYTLW